MGMGFVVWACALWYAHGPCGMGMSLVLLTLCALISGIGKPIASLGTMK